MMKKGRETDEVLKVVVASDGVEPPPPAFSEKETRLNFTFPCWITLYRALREELSRVLLQ